MSKLIKTTLISATTLVAAFSFSATAHASCNSGNLYCNSGSSTLKPLGSWTPSSNYGVSTTSYTQGTSFNTGSTRYISTPNVTSNYTQPSNTYSFYGSTTSATGLSLNESLRPTTCPTSVHNPDGGQVLGCYNVVQPVAQTQYYRVVRPVVYVRYPVPVAVPVYSCSTVVTNYSRYGGSYC